MIVHTRVPKFVAVLALVITLFGNTVLAATPALAAEQISHFDAQISIEPSGSIAITETIHYTTDQSKHGIYRYIPVRYHRDGWNYTTKITDLIVTDTRGGEVPFEQSHENGNLMLTIGDPDSTFRGEKTYVISYRVSSAVNLVAETEMAELYWDITGEGWNVPIASTTATVRTQDTTITRVTCYSGVAGSDDTLCNAQSSEHEAQFSYPHTVTYGDNVTIAVELDPAGLQLPSATERHLKRLIDNLPGLVAFVPGLVMLAWWWKHGRDWMFWSWNVFNNDSDRPQLRTPFWSRRNVPMMYEPIAELTPGQAGALYDEKVDIADIIAEIIDLARQKYLTIERVETKKLFIPHTEYVFTKLRDAKQSMPGHQAYLLKHLFAAGDTAKLSELKGTFFEHIELTKTMIINSLMQKKLFTQNPTKVRGIAFGVATMLSILVGTVVVHLFTLGVWWPVPIYIFSVIGALILAYHMPAKTAVGNNLAWQARGLQTSIQRGAWRERIKEKHLFFEEVLPFAIALGVVNSLTRDMEDLNVAPPDYLAANALHGWSTASFVQSFSSQASTALTHNPSSSSWSSGSGFSGGSSGGGGGGGGGGSW